ncbi:hypothetical protein [Methylobacterium sp. Leaf100]|uniref:hypothetical protein n=1 Tax=Methylobacterium sp. Leaf100 TaxID=1736252 RepID=UPI000AB382F3|nr:hypothetical protein [Methylobacterium sp. Leaf100]
MSRLHPEQKLGTYSLSLEQSLVEDIDRLCENRVDGSVMSRSEMVRNLLTFAILCIQLPPDQSIDAMMREMGA